MKMNNSVNIVFDVSKDELFKLTDNMKTLHRKLKALYKVEMNKNDITPNLLSGTKLLVLAGPQDKYTEEEFKYIKDYITAGGALLVFLAEGGEQDFNTNVNFLLEEYGMNINSDSVVRPHYYKYFHPKEAIISGGIGSDEMCKHLLQTNKSNITTLLETLEDRYRIEFVYPFGATINIAAPSTVVLTTGSVCYPFNRPIAGYYVNEKMGKILAFGSGHMFQDKYITNETNMAIWDYCLNVLLTKDLTFMVSDFSDLEISDNPIISDTIYLAEQPKACLVESIDCDIPADFKKMFDTHLYSINNNLLSDVIDTYEKLNVLYEPLKIIKPQFEIPLPQLQLAVFQPLFSELGVPPLELFDLDENFSSERSQLTQLTNKCMEDERKDADDKELAYYVLECAKIIEQSRDDPKVTAKEVLHQMGMKIANYKKL